MKYKMFVKGKKYQQTYPTLAISVCSKTGLRTICDAPSTSLGSSTFLSCYFSENVRETKRDFMVYHSKSHGETGTCITFSCTVSLSFSCLEGGKVMLT